MDLLTSTSSTSVNAVQAVLTHPQDMHKYRLGVPNHKHWPQGSTGGLKQAWVRFEARVPMRIDLPPSLTARLGHRGHTADHMRVII